MRAGAALRWWGRRTLHTRLSLLVTGAVAVAVLLFAGMAWVAVAGIQRHRIESQLRADAQAIAAQPDQWRAGRPGPGPRPGPGRHPRQLGPGWQILDAGATVVADPGTPLPVTAAARQVAAGRQQQVQERVTIGGDTYLMLTVPVRGGGAVQVAVSQDPSRDTLTAFGLLLAVGCVAGVGAAALLGRTVARAGLRPVERLTEAVEGVAVTMDLGRPIAVSGADEIARLGRSVNTMLAAIDTARRAQRTLVEDAGHELRTPLTSIRTNVELLLAVERQPELAHRLPPEDRAQLLADLEAQVGELATLTTELVELAREETTREAAEPVALADVVTAAVNRVRIRAPGLTFTTDLAPVTVTGRPGELERMVVNVLDNAAKWSPPGATVHTGLSREGDRGCRLTVADEGPGIAGADLPYVFDRFYRSAAARAMAGSGLGLAIVAQTAAQHGGTATAANRDPQGTLVTVHLPREAPLG
ncbi:ATP-binding protein [Nucisporomicrobium flavum]|uniref:HAMP domain-containing sensor histidine kinase n=1 Tax=Nucisporomicrobium flavum TaxID=2785915 RepID=UPI003C2F75C8